MTEGSQLAADLAANSSVRTGDERDGIHLINTCWPDMR
jgi:hypothetical protein